MRLLNNTKIQQMCSVKREEIVVGPLGGGGYGVAGVTDILVKKGIIKKE